MPAPTLPRDGFVAKPASPTFEAHQALSAWMESLPPDPSRWHSSDVAQQKATLKKLVSEQAPETQLLFLLAMTERTTWSREARHIRKNSSQNIPLPSPEAAAASYLFSDLVYPLAEQKLPWTLDALQTAFVSIADSERFDEGYPLATEYALIPLVKVAASFRKTATFSPALTQAIRRVHALFEARRHLLAYEARLAVALKELTKAPKRVPLVDEEEWAALALKQISQLPAKQCGRGRICSIMPLPLPVPSRQRVG